MKMSKKNQKKMELMCLQIAYLQLENARLLAGGQATVLEMMAAVLDYESVQESCEILDRVVEYDFYVVAIESRLEVSCDEATYQESDQLLDQDSYSLGRLSEDLPNINPATRPNYRNRQFLFLAAYMADQKRSLEAKITPKAYLANYLPEPIEKYISVFAARQFQFDNSTISSGNTPYQVHSAVVNKPIKTATCRTFIHQLLSIIPKDEILEKAKFWGTDKGAKGFSSWSHFIVMVFAQLMDLGSLRQIVGVISCLPDRYKELLLDAVPTRSSISYANTNRDWHFFKEAFELILEKIQKLMKVTTGQKFDFQNVLYSIDSTIISLCLKIFPWAKYRTGKGGIKIHTLLSHGHNYIPNFITMTEGKVSDYMEAMTLINQLEAGDIVTMDRGYFSYALFKLMIDKGIKFVTRTKKSINFITIEELLLPTDQDELLIKDNKTNTFYEIVSDKIVTSYQSLPSQPDNIHYRIVKIVNQTTNHTLEFITNIFDLSPKLISSIYKDRWAIEMFFKTIKQHFTIKTFFGTSDNAVLTQIYAVLTAVLLVKYLQSRAHSSWNFSNLIALLRSSFFFNEDLYTWLQIQHCEKIPPKQPEKQQFKQNTLF